MESRRLNGSPDVRMQRGYFQQHSPRGSMDNLFGVRVQVQGIKGQPFVVLNTPGQESHRDVSVITHQAGYNPGVVRRSVEDIPTQWAENSSVLHYQKHPEILKPYDPESNNLNHVLSVTTEPIQNHNSAPTAKPRIPLPARGSVEDQPEMAPDSMETPARSPNSVDTESFLSVGKLINQFNSSQRRGRAPPRHRIDSEDSRRARSVDGRRTSESASLASGRASSLKSTSNRSSAEIYPPGSARARLFGEEATFPIKMGASNSTGQTKTKPGNISSKDIILLQKSKVTSVTLSGGSDERDAQVTPDLLKGQQEMTADPPEDATKQILFTYLKDGSNDDDSTVERKVNLLLERINTLKWKTAEKVEEEEEEFAAQAVQLQEKHVLLEKVVSDLQHKLETEMKNEKTLAKACEKARTEKKKLQEDLAMSQNEIGKLKDKLAETEAELQTTKQELMKMKAERERSKTEMKDLQQQLSEMHDELDQAKRNEVITTDKEVLLKDMAQLRAEYQEMMHMKEEHEEVVQQQDRELTALKGALKEELVTHDKYMTALKDEYEVELQNVFKDLQLLKESNALIDRENQEAQKERGTARVQLKELSQERDQLKGRVQELNKKVDLLNQKIQESKAAERQLEQRARQLEREKQHAEEMLQEVRRNEEEMCQSNQSLLTRLEEVQGKLAKLNHEQRELKEKLREERQQVEELWKTKTELEDERRLQDQTVEKLQRKMNSILEDCEASTDVLQRQVDEAKERSQRELAELRRQLQEKGAELEKSRLAAKKLQDELLPLEDTLLQSRKEQQDAQQKGRQLEQRVKELEERNVTTVDDRERHVKLMEERIGQLEEDLNDERGGADRMMERLEKTKEQMDQMRSELMQERAASQNLECDKISLERQNKDLKSRVAHLEGSQRTNHDSLISKLNTRIQELEERLQGEEKDNNNLLQANRRLERKVKEMKMQSDEELVNLLTQRDQLTQRLKTAKRQMDQAEEEIERLEHGKKKLQRDLDEQMEANEQLHGQISVLRNDMRRRKKSSSLVKVVEEDENGLDDLVSD